MSNLKNHLKIESNVTLHLTDLRQAQEILEMMRDTHIGESLIWVPMNDCKAAGVRTLEKLGMIETIKFNDGNHYGRVIK